MIVGVFETRGGILFSRRAMTLRAGMVLSITMMFVVLITVLITNLIAVPASASQHKASQKLGSLRVTPPKDPYQGVTSRFRRLARRDDKKRLWQRALLRWQVVAAFTIQDAEAARRIEAIETWQTKQAAKYLRIAKGYLKKKLYGKAFKSFLRTLAYDGKNSLALAMVKFDLNARSLQTYQVVEGDTPTRIAKKAYNDRDLVFLVQYFNDLKRTDPLRPGTTLKIPVMADVLIPAMRPVPALVAKLGESKLKAQRGTAMAASKQPKGTQSTAATQADTPTVEAPTVEAPTVEAPTVKAPTVEAPKSTPAAPAPEASTDPASVTPAPVIAPTESTLVAALEAGTGAGMIMNNLVDSPQEEPEYDSSISEIGVRHAQVLFDEGQYADAAAQAESVLEEDPVNAKARGLVNESYYALGRHQSEQGDKLAAMQSFSRVPETYKDAASRKANLAEQLKGQQAEVHYINGVTFFLDEDLDGAIREWEQVIKLDPNHAQAPKDLANARALKAKLAQVQ